MENIFEIDERIKSVSLMTSSKNVDEWYCRALVDSKRAIVKNNIVPEERINEGWTSFCVKGKKDNIGVLSKTGRYSLSKELFFLEQWSVITPKIIAIEDSLNTYVLEYVNNSSILEIPFQKFLKLLEELYNTIVNVSVSFGEVSDLGKFRNMLNKNYRNDVSVGELFKIDRNLLLQAYQRAERSKNFQYKDFLDTFVEKYENIFSKGKKFITHGDLSLGNILYNKENDRFFVIDPKIFVGEHLFDLTEVVVSYDNGYSSINAVFEKVCSFFKMKREEVEKFRELVLFHSLIQFGPLHLPKRERIFKHIEDSIDVFYPYSLKHDRIRKLENLVQGAIPFDVIN